MNDIKRVAVLGIVHPASLPFLNDYLKSLSKQVFRNFVLFLFGHHIEKQQIQPLLDLYAPQIKVEFYRLNDDYTTSLSREKAIDYVINNGYAICIFTDTDDFYHQTYVKHLSETLMRKNCKIAFSDLSVYFSENNQIKNYFHQLHVPSLVDISYIKTKNCIGLGHSGIKLEIFSNNLPSFPDEIIAVDWWLFSMLMIVNKLSARFVNKSLCNYRQHQNNIAGFSKINEEKVTKGIQTKMLHYKQLSKIDTNFISLYNTFKYIYDKFQDDEAFREKYLEKVITQYSGKKFLWWEYIISPHGYCWK